MNKNYLLSAFASLSIMASAQTNSTSYTLVQNALTSCRTFLEQDTDEYAPNAIAELQDAIRLAEAKLAADNMTLTQGIKCSNSLKTKLSNAKATKGYAPKRVFAVTYDHGFQHPGGIVSQDDIERAKDLLAKGDTRIKKAWSILCANEYAQSGVATYPTETVVRGGSSGQNYMNAARGAAMAYQNALRWKIQGTKANADAAVRILMQWANTCTSIGGDSNQSLAAGLYGHAFANAAELMRDYEGWNRDDFSRFKQWMVNVWYSRSIDFLRRRHDTWLNASNSNKGTRPGHYWSNWGLCNALCVMSIGILCDNVHMYNQGVSFYKYDHVGTFKDRSGNSLITNDGCNEFIGNLVPVVLPDERGPLGYLSQMQESGRDQGHALMALGLALDICQVGLTQGDDLYYYMNDRIAAGAEFVAAMNFGNVASTSLPWIDYDYADCRGTLGAAWRQTEPNTGGMGEYRPYWDRIIGYYEGTRGIKMQYSKAASDLICPDGGGGNYSQNSGGFDNVGFSTLTSWRPAIDSKDAVTPLYGDIMYNGSYLKNQTNLGGLKYKYSICNSKAIPADGSDITLMPQLPEGTDDSGNWLWDTGETTKDITVKADKSYVYRVTYTAANGQKSRQAFSIAVCGDSEPETIRPSITYNEEVTNDTVITILQGSSITLTVTPAVGWTNDYLWDNGTKTNSTTIDEVMTSRTYTCQYACQSGAVSEVRFHINVVPATQTINETATNEIWLLPNSTANLRLTIPDFASSDSIEWQDGTTGNEYTIDRLEGDTSVTATFANETYTFLVHSLGNTFPIDATSLIINPDFETLDGTGWNITGTWGNQRFNGAVEVWHSNNFNISQTIAGLPDGQYAITCQLVNGEGSNTGRLYASSGENKTYATVKQSCSGSNFDNERNKMANNSNYGRLKTTIDVTGGTLTIGIEETASGTTWLVWDNFTLAYLNGTTTGITAGTATQRTSELIYDMQGRRISHIPNEGFYIKNNKKYIAR